MTPLIFQLRKEFRLLLPAWLFALGAISLAALVPGENWQAWLTAIALILLSVRAFGAEFQQGTFALFLSQPTQRNRLWLVKAGSLAIAMLAIIAAWHGLATAQIELGKKVSLPFGHSFLPGQIPWHWAIGLAAAGSGLFFSVLFRQNAAAIWATLLAPLTGMLGLTAMMFWAIPEGADAVLEIILNPLAVCYGVLSGLGSWLLFRRGEDLNRFDAFVAKSVPLGDGVIGWIGRIGLFRSSTAALVSKELGLQQINFLLMFALVGLHFLGKAIIHWGVSPNSPYVNGIRSITFLFLTFLPPLLIGCAAVAEERRLGVVPWHRTLPISMGRQWLIKILVVYLLSLFSAWGLPRLLQIVPGPRDMGSEVVWFPLIALGWATVGLFVSSLTRNLLSALGATFGLGAIFGIVGNALQRVEPWWLVNWTGNWIKGLIHLVVLTGGIALLSAIWILTCRNMKRILPNGRDVLFNLAVLLTTSLVCVGVSVAIFFRFWEFFVPYPEPEPVVRLQGPVTPKIDGSPFNILLPDGRLIVHRFAAVPSGGKRPRLLAQWNPKEPDWTPIRTPDDNFGNDTRWKDISGGPLIYAIRQDGTLWSWGAFYWSTNSLTPGLRQLPTAQPPKQIGSDSDWRSISASYEHVLALKNDGSLWAWGNNDKGQLGDGTTNSHSAPIRIGSETNWIKVSALGEESFGLKNDGTLWMWGWDLRKSGPNLKQPVLTVPTLLPETGNWRDIQLDWANGVGIKRDGTLWLLPLRWYSDMAPMGETQISADTDWKAIAPSWGYEHLLVKKDGSLWNFRISLKFSSKGHTPLIIGPKRVSKSSNWIAAGPNVALAADGSLIGRPLSAWTTAPPENKTFYLAPTRLCPYAVNLAQGIKP